MRLRSTALVVIIVMLFGLTASADGTEITKVYDVSEGGAAAFDPASPVGALRDFSNAEMKGTFSRGLLKVNLEGEGRAYMHCDLGIKERRDMSGHDCFRIYIENDCPESLSFIMRFDVMVTPDNPIWNGKVEGESYVVSFHPMNVFFESADGNVSTSQGVATELPGNFKGWLYIMTDARMDSSSAGEKYPPSTDLYRYVIHYVMFFDPPKSYREASRAFDSNIYIGDMELVKYDVTVNDEGIDAPTELPSATTEAAPTSTKQPIASVSRIPMMPNGGTSYEYYILLAAVVTAIAGAAAVCALVKRKKKSKA